MPTDPHASTEQTSSTGQRLALVVGVNRTASLLLPGLSHAQTDAESMARVLEEQCNFTLFATPLFGEQATSGAVKRAVIQMARGRTQEDFLLFYFSGHGQQYYDQDRAEVRHASLGTADFDERDVETDPHLHLSMHWLRDQLFQHTDAGRVLIILDCCFAEDIRTGSDHSLDELRQKLFYYFEIPGAEVGQRKSGLRVALAASRYDQSAVEQEAGGDMTGWLLKALRGEVPRLLEADGQLTLSRILSYVEEAMPAGQKPVISFSNSTGQECMLACYPDRVERPETRYARAVGAERPNSYVPFPRNQLFQPRPGEFERLETLLVGPGTEEHPARIGLVGVTGMGGVGKTQLAVELAHRCREQQRFPAGIFWMAAPGKTLFDWQRQFAELASQTGYLPADDDIAHPENEQRRAQHVCRYLARHADALLILDNVLDPSLVTTVLPKLIGAEAACSMLYTSRSIVAPVGVTTHRVERLPEDGALRLLLATTRAHLLTQIEAGSRGAEAEAARGVCQGVDYLPLALVHLRGWLAEDERVTLVRLLEVFRERGALELAKTQRGDAAPLFATFGLSWERIQDEEARRLFSLACSFPEATPIPLWLLGLAAGLGERADIFEPLGQAYVPLHSASLLEQLDEEQVRLHPLVREFGQRLVSEAGQEGTALQQAAGQRLAQACLDLTTLEARARREGYWGCLQQVRAMYSYAEWLGATIQAEQIGYVERWLGRESYLLANQNWWPTRLPSLFYQQLSNRAVEAGLPLFTGKPPMSWLRQNKPVGGEDQALLCLFIGHARSVRSVVFSPDGKWVLTGSIDGTARLWESESGRELARLHVRRGRVRSAVFSPDGKWVLTGSIDRTVRLWESESGRVLAQLEGHTGSVRSVAFSPDGKLLLSGSSDRTVRLWEVESGRELARLEGHTGSVRSVAFSFDGKWVLSGSSDRTVRLWNAENGQELARLEGHTDAVSSVAFSPDGKWILTGSYDRTVRLWNAENGQELARLEGHTGLVNSVAFSPDGKRVLSGSSDRTVRLWEVEGGRKLVWLEGDTGLVNSVAFSPDGKRVLIGSADGRVRLWEVEGGRELARLHGHTGSVSSVAFSPDGKWVLTGSRDETARLWEVESGRELTRLEGHTGSVSSVAFSPDGKWVLTGSWDRTVRLWEVESGRKLAKLVGHTDLVSSVVFSPDGRLAITCDDQGGVFFWYLRTQKSKSDRLGGLYMATSRVATLHWQDATSVILADLGGSRGRPHCYYLMLEGMGKERDAES